MLTHIYSHIVNRRALNGCHMDATHMLHAANDACLLIYNQIHSHIHINLFTYLVTHIKPHTNP